MENINEELHSLPINNGLKFDDLPEIIYRFYLFPYLDLCDIYNLKLLSKKFNSIVNSYNIKELSIIDQLDNSDHIYKDNWFSTIKSIKLRNTIIVSRLCPIISLPNNLRNLQNLSIQGHVCESFRLDDLNKFGELQILHLHLKDVISKYHFLQLSNLIALSIYIQSVKFHTLIIDTPKLVNLRIVKQGRQEIEFKHPQSIKYLKVDKYHKMIRNFINLQCIEFDGDNFPLDDSLMLNNLKKIKNYNDCVLSNEDILFWVEIFFIKFVFNGVKIKESYKIDEYKYGFNILRFQLTNYGELEDDLNFVEKMDYNKLIRLLPNNRLPSDLFKKYTNIQSLSIGLRIKDEDQLIHFIKGCTNLYNLCIYESSIAIDDLYLNKVSQEFYNQLPKISSLTSLSTYDKGINYSFINEMTYLTSLCVYENIFKNRDINLNRLKYLKEVGLEIENPSHKICKHSVDRYYYDYRYKFAFKNLCDFHQLTLNELVEKINEYFK